MLEKKTRCQPWKGSRNQAGYGLVRVDGKTRLAHRVSFELANGPIPEGKIICHKCDNPPCVRPDHLYAGTHQDNARDAMAARLVAKAPKTIRLARRMTAVGLRMVAKNKAILEVESTL